MIRVKLAADCYVKGEIRKAGEEVSLPKEIAASFGKEVKPEPPGNNPPKTDHKPEDK